MGRSLREDCCTYPLIIILIDASLDEEGKAHEVNVSTNAEEVVGRLYGSILGSVVERGVRASERVRVDLLLLNQLLEDCKVPSTRRLKIGGDIINWIGLLVAGQIP